MEKLTLETIETLNLPEGIMEIKKSLEGMFTALGAERTVDDWIVGNVETAVESGVLVGLTVREQYIFGLVTLLVSMGR